MKKRIRNLYNQIIIRFFSNSCHICEEERSYNIRFFHACGNEYMIEFVKNMGSEACHKWVGAQYYLDKVFTVPNDETRVMVLENEISYIENIKPGDFKWTGGCIWNNALYCFPRTSNSFLKITGNIVEEIPLTISYSGEHHYSGVCTKDGVVYQPPRNTNHILKTDLKTGESKKIPIVDDLWHVKFGYCGGIVHPNGFIYFFPEDGRVIKINPKNDRWCFIGRKISTMCFDAKVGFDGNIYGYSAYRKGIMKIDVKKDTVEMIHQEILPGAYGTKYGIDGCLYSVPGDGTKIWKFVVETDEVIELYDLNDNSKAKYAGGVTMPDGTIVCVPATANDVLILKPSSGGRIPEDLYETLVKDFY